MPENAMSRSYIVEIGDEAVGLVMVEGSAYHFIAASRSVQELEGQVFSSVRDARKAAEAALNARGSDKSRRRTAA